MVVWGGLTNSWEKRSKGKGEKERSTYLNAEFQIARRDKKAFLSNQCKEIEETNRLGKTRDLFKKIRHTKETFHAKMGTVDDRNGVDLTEAEDIKKRWQEYIELYKKELHNQDDHSPRARHPGMWSQVGRRKHHHEQNQWRWWNSSWAISNPKRWWCENAAFNMAANLENSAVATGLEKVSCHSNPKECSNCPTIALIPHASKLMLKIL